MSPPSTEPFPRIPGYRLESILGQGSMATVYRATQTGMNRPVAVKVLRSEILRSDKIVKRLMREARIAARFNHRHIVRAHDAGVTDGVCWFVMELVEGASLRELVERKGRLPEERALRIAIEVAEALHLFERERVVHRDVKPANIMIDGEGQALLADLGLAKLEFDSSMTSKDHAVGTPAYMSPEQARDPDGVDIRSDVFSLGATLYYILTGQPPFEAPTVGAVITRILYEQPQPPRDLVPELSEEIERVVLKMLSKRPEERFRGPGELLRDLRAIEAGRQPPTEALADRDRRGRRRRLVVGGGSALVLLTAALALILANHERRRADPEDHEATRSVPIVDPDGLADADLLRVIRGERVGVDPSVARERLLVHMDGLLDLAVDELLLEAGKKGASAVRHDIASKLEEKVSARLSIAFVELPPEIKERVEAARRRADARIADLEANERRGRRDAVLAVWQRSAETMLAAEHWPAQDEIEARLAADLATEGRELDEADRKLLEEDRAALLRRCLAAVRDDVDRVIVAARGEREAGSFAAADRRLAAALARGPERCEPELQARLEEARRGIGEALLARRRELARAAAGVDLLGEGGRPELAGRDFAAALAVLDRSVQTTPEEDEERRLLGEEWTLVLELRGLLREAVRWHEAAVASLLDRAKEPVDLETISGEVLRGAVAESADDVGLRLAVGGTVRTLAIRSLTSTCLLRLAAVPEGRLRVATAAFLDYCDRRLVDAESGIARLAEEDPLRVFFEPRIRAALVAFEQVTTPAERNGFDLWRAAVKTRREGGLAEAGNLLARLLDDPLITGTAWFKSREGEIRSARREIERQRKAWLAFRGHKGRITLDFPPAGPARLEGRWDFESADQAADFEMPTAMRIEGGALVRSAPEPSPRVRPDEIEPLSLLLPIDPHAGILEVEFIHVASAEVGEEPRTLTLSVGERHLTFLSRLSRRHQFRRLPLHGLEDLVTSMETFGRVATWEGGLDGCERAFQPLDRQPQFLLEPGRRTRILLRLDPAIHGLSLSADDTVLLSLTNVASPGPNARIAIRIPRRGRIDDLRVLAPLLEGR